MPALAVAVAGLRRAVLDIAAACEPRGHIDGAGTPCSAGRTRVTTSRGTRSPVSTTVQVCSSVTRPCSKGPHKGIRPEAMAGLLARTGNACGMGTISSRAWFRPCGRGMRHLSSVTDRTRTVSRLRLARRTCRSAASSGGSSPWRDGRVTSRRPTQRLLQWRLSSVAALTASSFWAAHDRTY